MRPIKVTLSTHKKLSEEIEKLKSIQNKISTLKAQVKDLEEDEKYFVYDVIPKNYVRHEFKHTETKRWF